MNCSLIWELSVNCIPYFPQAGNIKAMETKESRYAEILATAGAIIDPEADDIANMANIAALLHQTFGFWWTGFYRVIGDELVLGPYQGPPACTRIAFGRGVCGTAWQTARTLNVPDVHKFPGHIACSSESNSEIVVPVARDGRIFAVLDIDSREFGTFDRTDEAFLERIVSLL